MLIEEKRDIVEVIGPFERARTNLEKFAWNYMILYTTATLVKTYDFIAQGDEETLKLTKITADATLKGVFELVLAKNNDVWD